jgi:hypothetical protein
MNFEGFRKAVTIQFKNMTIITKKPTNRVEDCEELDDVVGDCEIFLYTKPAEFSSIGKFLLSITRNEDNIYFQKWFLVARFSRDGRVYTFEAVENDSGRMEAIRTTGSVPADPKEKLAIGTVRTSPQKLLSLAQKHPYNGTTTPILATLKKCQDWLNEFLRMVSPSLNLP